MNSDICGDANGDSQSCRNNVKKVQILMSTYNGEEYIREQMDSILSQNYQDVDILVRDDGSSDDTFVILKEYEEYHQNVRVYKGENIGINKSFFELLKCSDDHAQYIGFCDQDDYWLPEKIERAVEKLEQISGPALYCGAKTLVDENLNVLEKQPRQNVRPGFGNAVIESICSGCTSLMNQELVTILKSRLPEDVIHHDWWCYMAATYLGDMYYDEHSYIYYRQHASNEVGASGSPLAMIRAKARDLKKRHGDLKKQLKDFKSFYQGMGDSRKDTLIDSILRAESISGRISIQFNTDWYRQTTLDNLVVRVLFLVNRML
ncbi:MAG: glycosyltransferase family 2 protein [Lachnospiraceae bacterium]